LTNGESSIEVPGYSIIKKIGEGGMANVFLATQHSLDRQVALKVLSPDISQDDSFGVRFLQEAKWIANLDHQNIVPVYEVGKVDNSYFLSMALLDGGDLKQRLSEKIEKREALKITRQIATALGVAHEKGIVHRDIKPQNILFRSNGMPLLTDFGIAKAVGERDQNLTMTGMMIGSPHYLSPEQALAQPVDQRSDIYSLGVVLYEMLTGKLPFNADSAVATAMQHVSVAAAPMPPELQEFQSLLSAMMAKNVEDRLNNVDDLIKAIDQLLDHGAYVGVQEGDEKTVVMKAVASPSVTRAPKASKSEVAPANAKSKLLYVVAPIVLCLVVAVVFFFLGDSSSVEVPSTPVALNEKEIKSGLATQPLSQTEFKEVTSASTINVPSVAVNQSVSNKLNVLDEFVSGPEKIEPSVSNLATEASLPAPKVSKPTQRVVNKTTVPSKKKTLPSAIKELISSFVLVPSGDFKMGIKKAGVVDARPVHKVSMKSFKISKYPVTNEQFSVFKALETKRSMANHPVVNVSWDEANEFANWLSKKSAKNYRLPSEAEWEYIARAHQAKTFHWGNGIGKNQTNCNGCKSEWDNKSTSPVDSFTANSLGVYDLIGNVWEWTADCYAPNYRNASANGSAYSPSRCEKRALRGGSWNTPKKKVHPAFRAAVKPGSKLDNLGFRLVEG